MKLAAQSTPVADPCSPRPRAISTPSIRSDSLIFLARTHAGQRQISPPLASKSCTRPAMGSYPSATRPSRAPLQHNSPASEETNTAVSAVFEACSCCPSPTCRGKSARSTGRTATARTSIELSPTLAVAHCALGDSLANGGRYEESIACFERSIALSPSDPQLWAFYTYSALTTLFMGNYDRALRWLDQARSNPNHQYWIHGPPRRRPRPPRSPRRGQRPGRAPAPRGARLLPGLRAREVVLPKGPCAD